MSGQCQICFKNEFKYTCPKCNIVYCCVECYKSPQHLKCSEEFYKNCIEEELTAASPGSSEDVRKIYNILKRIRESDAGLQPNDNFDDDLLEPLDSDDDPYESAVEEEEEEDDLAIRLQGVDINDSNEVWEKLTTTERENFQRMVVNGEINKLLPDFKPWWQANRDSKIVDLTSNKKEPPSDMPRMNLNIPKFSDLCKKTPSPCLHFNIWNIMGAYSCMVRFFGGEHKNNPWDASLHLINLSSTLKYNTNFEDVEDALVSVQMEGLDTVDKEYLQFDAKQLMKTVNNKLLVISDILQLLEQTKQHMKRSKKEVAEFQKLFAMCSGNVELNSKKLNEIIKKMEFLFAYILADSRK